MKIWITVLLFILAAVLIVKGATYLALRAANAQPHVDVPTAEGHGHKTSE